MKVVHKHFPKIYSTNTWALQNAEALERDALTIVTCEEQTAGRGRQRRLWIAPPGCSLLTTYCFFSRKPLVEIANIGQVFALCCSELLELLGISNSLKWPNDLLINGKKVGGILCETRELQPDYFVAIGLGLNINMDRQMVEEIDQPATSLMLEQGKSLSIPEVGKMMDQLFLKALTTFNAEGFAPFFSAYKERIGIGKEVAFHNGDLIIEGRLIDISQEGALILEEKNGKRSTFYSGKIINKGKESQIQCQG